MFEVQERPKIRIRYGGNETQVRRIRNLPDSIMLGPDGALYMSFWTTPENRQKKSVRRFRRYPDIYSLYRGVYLALEQAKNARIPTLEELKEDCREIGGEVQSTTSCDVEEIEDQKGRIAEILKSLNGVRTPELREAQNFATLALPFRDSLGRINFAMVSARLSATQRRFIERLKNILGWLNFYGQWKEAIRTFYLFHKNFLPRLASTLYNLVNSEIDDFVKKEKMEVLYSKLSNLVADVEHLSNICGWKFWVANLKLDVQEAELHLRHGQTEKTKECFSRARQATLLKISQHDIHALLLEIGLDAVNESCDSKKYETRTTQLIKEIRTIKDSDWKTPIKKAVLSELCKAYRVFGKNPDKKGLEKAKEYLRKAYRLAS